MTYAIEFRPSVEKRLRKVPQKDLKKIKRKIDDLAGNLPDLVSGDFVQCSWLA